MNSKYQFVKESLKLGPTSSVAPANNFPLAYVPTSEDCGECEDDIHEQAIGMSPGPSAAVTGGGLEHGKKSKPVEDDHEDKIPGGLADDNRPEDFDQSELKMGIDVEKEHTDDEDMAREIAMDHLKEIPDYYTRLKHMEDEAEGLNQRVQESFSLLNELKVINENHQYFLQENPDVYLDLDDYAYLVEFDLFDELGLVHEKKKSIISRTAKRFKETSGKAIKAARKERHKYHDLESMSTKWMKYGIGTLIGAETVSSLARAAVSKHKHQKVGHIAATSVQTGVGIAGAGLGGKVALKYGGVAAAGIGGLTGSLIAQLPVGAVYTWWTRRENDKCRNKCKTAEGNREICWNQCYIRAAGNLIGRANKDLKVVEKKLKTEKDPKKLKSLAKLQNKIYKQIAFYRKKQEGYRKNIAKIKASEAKKETKAKMKKAKARAKARAKAKKKK